MAITQPPARLGRPRATWIKIYQPLLKQKQIQEEIIQIRRLRLALADFSKVKQVESTLEDKYK